jgi:hypothetical protein
MPRRFSQRQQMSAVGKATTAGISEAATKLATGGGPTAIRQKQQQMSSNKTKKENNNSNTADRNVSTMVRGKSRKIPIIKYRSQRAVHKSSSDLLLGHNFQATGQTLSEFLEQHIHFKFPLFYYRYRPPIMSRFGDTNANQMQKNQQVQQKVQQIVAAAAAPNRSMKTTNEGNHVYKQGKHNNHPAIKQGTHSKWETSLQSLSWC